MNINLSSRSLFWSVLNLILIVMLIFGLKILFFGYQRGVERYITAQAEGKVVVSPNIANISFSVVTEGKDVEEVQKENSEKMNRAIEFVKSQGIDSEDIKTTGYNLYPKYSSISRFQDSIFPIVEQKIIGYTLTQNVSVKLRDLKNVSKILGGLPDAGVNQIWQLSFDVEDPDIFLNQAREEAFKKARAKAEVMAKQNNVRIKKVITFSDSYNSGGIFPVSRFAESDTAKASVPPTLEPGSQEVVVNVSVTYQIR